MIKNADGLFSGRRRIGALLPFVLLGFLMGAGVVMDVAFSRSVEARTAGGGYSAAGLFNQANAESRAGRIGQAIADYERAKLLARTDARIAANLQTVRDRAGLPSFAPNWLDRVVSWESPNFWAMAGSAGLIVAGTGLLAARAFPRWTRLGRLAGAGGVVLVLFCGLSAFVSWQAAAKTVVIAPEAPARISPTTIGEVAFKLREGEIARVRGRYGDFVLVRDVAGHAGWVKRNDLAPIIPD